MNYFSKNKKWMAYLILLTFLFTCVMPSNLSGWNSVAEAAEGITLMLMQGEAKNIESSYAGGKLEWTSDNSNVVEVSGNGDNNKTATITAKAQGKAIITAYTVSGKNRTVRDTWTVEVSAFKAEKVDTFDTKAAGVSITMKDLENNKRPFTDGPFGTGFMTPDLVKRTLTSGYPVLKSNGTSLINCFNGEDVTGLFLKSKYDADGTFYYNSFENAAILEGTVLQPYKQLMTPEKNNNNALYARGNFLPYNHFPDSYNDNNVGRNRYNEDGSDLNKDAARYNEALFIPKDGINFHFGMMVSASFAQPKDGQISGKNMVFKFNGDDDLWVFIDDALVLDIGGIHIAQKGTIDFATGEVVVDEVDQKKQTRTHTTTIKAQFLAAAEEDENFTYDATVFDGDTFADFTKHEIKIFYMERGEGASDLKMEFNLPTFSGNPELQKLVEVNDAFVNDSKEYQFKIEVADNATGKGATPYTDKASIVRQNGKVQNITNVSDGIVNLKHGELAALNVAEGKYVHVKELNGNTNFTKHHVIQKPKTVLEDRDKDSGKGTESDWHQVSFKNDENKLVEQRLFYQFFNTVEKTDLSITKQLDEGLIDTDTEFQFKVYFKNNVGENDLIKQMSDWTLYKGKLGAGSTGTIDSNGIISLKAGQTAVLKDIPVGTEYFVEEVLPVDSEYVVKETLTTETIEGSSVQGIKGTISNTSPISVGITNTKYITVNGSKTWADNDDQDGKRPASIKVQLQKKIGEGDWSNEGAARTVTNNQWQFEGLAKYSAGTEIQYRVVELNAENQDVANNGVITFGAGTADEVTYTVTYSGYNITNTHVPETVTIKIVKEWAGEAGYTALRGTRLNFDVIGQVNGTTVIDRDVAVTADDNWAAKTITVPKYHNGEVITYTITETVVPEGYEATYEVNGDAGNRWHPEAQPTVIERFIAFVTGRDTSAGDVNSEVNCTVTVTNTLQTAGIKLTKAYSGGIFNGQTNVTNGAVFTLTGNGETITLTRSDDVYATTSAALKYGVVYTLHENAPTGYTPAADQYLKLVKVDDAYKVVACDVNGNVLTDDKAAAYSLNSGDIADLGTITNYVVKGSFVFTKAFNSTPVTPAFTVYEAVKNGDVYTRDNAVNGAVSNEGVVYTISDLECGKSYEVVETASGYEPVTFYLDVAEDSGAAVVTLTKTLVANTQVARDSVWTINNGAYTLTNQAKTTQLILTKTYDGQQENKIDSGVAAFDVYTDASYANKFTSVTFNADSGNYIFTGLEFGKTYYVKEIAPAGFASVTFTITVGVTDNGAVVAAINGYTANQDGSYTVNNEIKTTSLTFDKVYVGPQPAAKATFKVTNNNDAEVTMSEGKYTISNLKYGYTYNVVENAPEGYVPVAFTVAVGTDGELIVSQTKADGYETIDAIETADGVVTVKNYLKQDTVDLFGTKSWIGGTTDSAIEIKLFRDGVEQATTATSIEFHWKYIFAGLDRFNLETGEAYEYAVEETLINGFTAYYDETVTANGIQIDITNVKDAEMIAISGQKVWHDVAGTEHEPITVVLYRSIGDGKEEVARVTLNGEEEWKYDFGLLPKADPDSHIYYKYEVEELNVPEGYVSVVNGYDIHNIATPLYELGEISVTKKVEGTPENPNAAYDFVLYVKATVKGTLDSAQQKLQAVLAADYLNLRDTELPEAEEAAKTAQTAFENSVFLTATSSSVYQYFLTDNTDNAVIGLTTGSAYYVEHVNVPLESQQSEVWNNFSNMVGALVAAIEDLAEEFLNAVAEDPAKAKPTQSVMLSRIAQDKDVERIKATTTSAIAFDADKLQGLFDSVVEHKTTLQEFKDAEAAWNAFDESVTTPTAIILIVNGAFDTPIELDPEKGHQSETDETILEFTVENGEYTETVRFNTATGQYEIPFTLLKDETIKFNMKAATGSAIEYYITETKPVDDYYDHTDIKAYLYNGSAEDLEDTLQKEEFLWEKRLTSETSKLTSGSAATYEFYNHYKEDTPPPGGGDYTPPYTPPVNPPKDPEEVIDDPEVPLDKPEIPEEQVVVPGEELEDPEIPLGDAPATGDTTQAVPFVALMLIALAGLFITRKKFN